MMLEPGDYIAFKTKMKSWGSFKERRGGLFFKEGTRMLVISSELVGMNVVHIIGLVSERVHKFSSSIRTVEMNFADGHQLRGR